MIQSSTKPHIKKSVVHIAATTLILHTIRHGRSSRKGLCTYTSIELMKSIIQEMRHKMSMQIKQPSSTSCSPSVRVLGRVPRATLPPFRRTDVFAAVLLASFLLSIISECWMAPRSESDARSAKQDFFSFFSSLSSQVTNRPKCAAADFLLKLQTGQNALLLRLRWFY